MARGLERSLEEALAAVERERRALRDTERARPAPLSDQERRSLGRLARELPRIW